MEQLTPLNQRQNFPQEINIIKGSGYRIGPVVSSVGYQQMQIVPAPNLSWSFMEFAETSCFDFTPQRFSKNKGLKVPELQ